MNAWSAIAASERTFVVRHLLARPLIHRRGMHAATVDMAHAHQAELRSWFESHLGWHLRVEPDRVRLFKVPSNLRRQETGHPTARQCALFCLLLAALEECGSQTIISELASRVDTLTRTHPGLRPFDATVGQERRDLVAMIRLLSRHRVLLPHLDAAVTREHEQDYVRGDGDALYDIDHRTTALMLADRASPEAGDHEAFPNEGSGSSGVSTDRSLYHAVMRRLVDDPVMYLEDLTADERDYFLRHTLRFTRALHAGAGLRLEIRSEGAAVIDGDLTDLQFPGGSGASFAALVTADRLFLETRRNPARSGWISESQLRSLTEAVAHDLRPVMPRINSQAVDGERVWTAARPILAGLDLIRLHENGIEVRPALARFRDPTGRGVRHPQQNLMLFGTDAPTATDDTPDDPDL